MRVTHDPDVDMAYIYLVEIPDGGVGYTETLIIDLPAGRRFVNLDFDHDGRLVGVEIDGAVQTLPAELLREARPTLDTGEGRVH